MATKDVEMTDVAPEAPKDQNNAETKTSETGEFLLSELKKHNTLLERAVDTADTRPVSRVLRSLGNTRRKLTAPLLRDYIATITAGDSEDQVKLKNSLTSQLSSFPEKESDPNAMDISEPSKDATPKEAPKSFRLIPEIDIYARLLVVIFLIDNNKHEEALEAANTLLEKFNEKQTGGPRSLDQFNLRTLNPLSVKVFFYFYRAHELLHKEEEIRAKLLALHRTATLRHNDEGSVTLLNLLLRNYLTFNLYEQADKLISKVQFKEEAASNNEFARYLYYQGRIKSIQLDYADAYASLLGAMRKAPQHSARGFRLAVTKLACIVQCLIGEIPERSLFRQPGLKKGLAPYLELVKAVRVGFTKFPRGHRQTRRHLSQRQDIHSHTEIETQCDQDRSAKDQRLLLQNFPRGHSCQTTTGQCRGRGIHRCKGHSRQGDQRHNRPRQQVPSHKGWNCGLHHR